MDLDLDVVITLIKKYANQVGVSNYKEKVLANELVLNSDGMYEKTITHGLNTNNLIVCIVDDNGDSILEMYDRVDANSILLKNDVAENLNVLIVKY